MKIYDKDGRMVKMQEYEDYDYICGRKLAWCCLSELGMKDGKTGKIFKATKGKKGRIYRKLIERF